MPKKDIENTPFSNKHTTGSDIGILILETLADDYLKALDKEHEPKFTINDLLNYSLGFSKKEKQTVERYLRLSNQIQTLYGNAVQIYQTHNSTFRKYLLILQSVYLIEQAKSHIVELPTVMTKAQYDKIVRQACYREYSDGLYLKQLMAILFLNKLETKQAPKYIEKSLFSPDEDKELYTKNILASGELIRRIEKTHPFFVKNLEDEVLSSLIDTSLKTDDRGELIVPYNILEPLIADNKFNLKTNVIKSLGESIAYGKGIAITIDEIPAKTSEEIDVIYKLDKLRGLMSFEIEAEQTGKDWQIIESKQTKNVFETREKIEDTYAYLLAYDTLIKIIVKLTRADRLSIYSLDIKNISYDNNLLCEDFFNDIISNIEKTYVHDLFEINLRKELVQKVFLPFDFEKYRIPADIIEDIYTEIKEYVSLDKSDISINDLLQKLYKGALTYA